MIARVKTPERGRPASACQVYLPTHGASGGLLPAAIVHSIGSVTGCPRGARYPPLPWRPAGAVVGIGAGCRERPRPRLNSR